MKSLNDGEPTGYFSQLMPDTVDPAKNRRQPPTGLVGEPTGKDAEGSPSGPRNKLGLLGH